MPRYSKTPHTVTEPYSRLKVTIIVYFVEHFGRQGGNVAFFAQNCGFPPNSAGKLIIFHTHEKQRKTPKYQGKSMNDASKCTHPLKGGHHHRRNFAYSPVLKRWVRWKKLSLFRAYKLGIDCTFLNELSRKKPI